MNFFSFIGSFFGVGYLRPFPATWASLVSGNLLYFFWPSLDMVQKVISILIILFLGTVVCENVQKKTSVQDPSYLVIDEVLGMMIATVLLAQMWWQWLIAFFFFRIFDILKPWPASYFDRQKGGLHIMMDDVIAALYTALMVFFFSS